MYSAVHGVFALYVIVASTAAAAVCTAVYDTACRQAECRQECQHKQGEYQQEHLCKNQSRQHHCTGGGVHRCQHQRQPQTDNRTKDNRPAKTAKGVHRPVTTAKSGDVQYRQQHSRLNHNACRTYYPIGRQKLQHKQHNKNCRSHKGKKSGNRNTQCSVNISNLLSQYFFTSVFII